MFAFTTTAFAPRPEDLAEYFFDPVAARLGDDDAHPVPAPAPAPALADREPPAEG